MGTCWPNDAASLLAAGVRRMWSFCEANGLSVPAVNVITADNWHFGPCAYYRPDTEAERKWLDKGMGKDGYGTGINICLAKCARLAPESECRNWSWPGSVTDREPAGVIAHELGHHCDWLAGEKKGRYWSDYSAGVRAESGEKPLTSYDDGDHEWFAEHFRLFVTNHALLRQLRPRTHEILSRRWKPVGDEDWRAALGGNVPARVLRTLTNKGAA